MRRAKIELIDGKAFEELIGSASVARPTPHDMSCANRSGSSYRLRFRRV